MHVLHSLDELFERVRLDLGRAPQPYSVVQQVSHLRIEDLPREAARLLQHDAAVLRIGVVAEVRAFVDEALALGVDHDAERVAVLLELVADVRARRIAARSAPTHRMTAGPLAVRLRADVERHADAVAGVVARAAHFRHVPAGAEIARAPFAIRFETAATRAPPLCARISSSTPSATTRTPSTPPRPRSSAGRLRAVANLDAALARALYSAWTRPAPAARGFTTVPPKNLNRPSCLNA